MNHPLGVLVFTHLRGLPCDSANFALSLSLSFRLNSLQTNRRPLDQLALLSGHPCQITILIIQIVANNPSIFLGSALLLQQLRLHLKCTVPCGPPRPVIAAPPCGPTRRVRHQWPGHRDGALQRRGQRCRSAVTETGQARSAAQRSAGGGWFFLTIIFEPWRRAVGGVCYSRKRLPCLAGVLQSLR